MTTIQELNHWEISETQVLQQYKESNVSSLLKSFYGDIQDLETALLSVYKYRNIWDAYGMQLDGLGSILGEPRYFRADEAYKYALMTRIFINNGGGTPEDIINTLFLLFRPTIIEYSELQSAYFQVYLETQTLIPNIKTLVRSIRPIAIQDIVILVNDDESIFGVNEALSYLDSLQVDLLDGTIDILQVDLGGGNTDTLQIDFNNVLNFRDILGFSEQIITRANLLINSENATIYFVDNASTPLEIELEENEFELDETNSGTLAEGFFE